VKKSAYKKMKLTESSKEIKIRKIKQTKINNKKVTLTVKKNFKKRIK